MEYIAFWNIFYINTILNQKNSSRHLSFFFENRMRFTLFHYRYDIQFQQKPFVKAYV